MKKVVICSGGFDPLHSGHLDMFEDARKNGDFVFVCLNSDEWLIKKKGYNFLDFEDREKSIKSNKFVDDVFSFDDSSGSAVEGIKTVVKFCESKISEPIEFYFANGGDRNKNSTPSEEQKYCEKNGIGLLWNIGGGKVNSSSWIINRFRNWHFEMDDRIWGNYKVIYQDTNKKVKILEIMPGKSISLQTHSRRSEHWVVVEGTATVYLESDKRKIEQIIERNESIYVHVGEKHKLTNNTNEILQIVEVQIGDYLEEDDIVRYD